jgi:WhiB family redox-sensing transcriptional regulator
MSAVVAQGARTDDEYVPACTSDPERWTTPEPEEEAKSLCRQCPLRWSCARAAWETPGAEGLWAGIVIPESGRGRDFALRKVRSLAERGGYPVRPRNRARRAAAMGNGSP